MTHRQQFWMLALLVILVAALASDPEGGGDGRARTADTPVMPVRPPPPIVVKATSEATLSAEPVPIGAKTPAQCLTEAGLDRVGRHDLTTWRGYAPDGTTVGVGKLTTKTDATMTQQETTDRWAFAVDRYLITGPVKNADGSFTEKVADCMKVGRTAASSATTQSAAATTTEPNVAHANALAFAFAEKNDSALARGKQVKSFCIRPSTADSFDCLVTYEATNGVGDCFTVRVAVTVDNGVAERAAGRVGSPEQLATRCRASK